MKHRLGASVLALLCALLVAPTARPAHAQQMGESHHEIVNGTASVVEPVVQIWTRNRNHPDRDPFGRLCSAVLIDQHWALTAAHCVYIPDVVDFRDRPEEIILVLDWRFHNAIPVDDDDNIRIVGEIFVHPVFADLVLPGVPSGLTDLALLWIPEGVQHIAPALMRDEPIIEDVVDYNAPYFPVEIVGFGCDTYDRIPGVANGSGLQRTGEANVLMIGETTFLLDGDRRQQASCAGDSGGATFWTDSDGVKWLVGIISAQGRSGSFVTSVMRIDTQSSWINTATGEPFGGCGTCLCDLACREDDGYCEDGVCNNSPAQGCAAFYSCLRICSQHHDGDAAELSRCSTQCAALTSTDGLATLEALFACGASTCPAAAPFEESGDRCFEQHCLIEQAACFGDDQAAPQDVPGDFRGNDDGSTGGGGNSPVDELLDEFGPDGGLSAVTARLSGCQCDAAGNSGTPLGGMLVLLVFLASPLVRRRRS